jgi:FAD/FMN-containing dehydrogenase
MAQQVRLAQSEVEALRASLRGPVIAAADPGYDEARKLYNGMIDKRPAALAQCMDAGDVMTCVNFARNQGLDLAVRGGGHNGPGLGSVDDGLVIDLRLMRGVRVDPENRIAHVSGGALLGDVDHATGAFGLAVPVGILSTTGIGGLTLGGGMGNTTRTWGLTIDNLVEADVVLADGSLVKASEKEHEDLFWALRGGSGNFGVVTHFAFQLHPAQTVTFGPTLWHLDDAADVLRFYREYLPSAPDSVNGYFAFLTVPPVPPFPEELHLKKMAAIAWCYTGDPDKAEEAFKPALAVRKPALHGIMTVPVPAMNSAFDPLYPPGTQQYWRADFIDSIPDEAVQLNVEHASKMPTPQCTSHIYNVDGAAGRVGKDDTAWAYRDAKWAQVFFAVDPDPANAGALKDWCVQYYEALHPYSMGGAYVNFMMEEGQDRVQATYRDHYDRLAKIKATYDPDNLFHVNQNIKPAK